MAKRYRLVGADGDTYLSDVPGTLAGNLDGIYGRFDCSAALTALRRWGDAYRERRVFFADETTARAAGYRPCGRCMPDAYRTWKATSSTGTQTA